MRRLATRLICRAVLPAVLIFPAASCASSGAQPGPSGAAARIVADAPGIIHASLDSTAAGWNRGDLAAYLAAYTDDATEMLATGPAGGREQIEKTMREGFWKAGRPSQHLRYDNVLVRMLGTDGAVVTGLYVLSGPDINTGAALADRKGWFTTVWIRTARGWRMMHDAS